MPCDVYECSGGDSVAHARSHQRTVPRSVLCRAAQLLSWAERSDRLAVIGGWCLDWPSFALGALAGILVFILIELWFTVKWVLIGWLERRSSETPSFRVQLLYKLC